MAVPFPPETRFLSIPDLVEILGISPSRVRRLIEDHHLAAVRVDGTLRVPEVFIQDDEPLSSLHGTLLALLDAGFSEEEAIAWLLAENDELGDTPVQTLRAGRKSAVRRATQSLAF